MVSDLTYDLRGGSPDFVDKLVATTFANMALDALTAKKHGVMTAIVNGCMPCRRFPIRSSGRARSTLRRCTTRTATGRSIPTGWGSRSCSASR